MRVTLNKSALLIEPETEFERLWIDSHFYRGENIKCYVKTGLAPAELVGIKVEANKA
jgi:hypothetical protein